MTEQALNTIDAQSVNAGLDLEGLNDPMDAMGTFNLEQLDKDATDPGDPPAKKQMTSGDLQKRYQMQVQGLKNLGEVGIAQMADKSRNKFQAARVVEFDAKKLNIDRYLGYSKSTFNKVGFSPFVDNEKNFNENTTIWQDFGRMSTIFGSLAYEGGVSGYRSIGGMFNGDSFYTPDDETAENFAKLQSIGMSSRGGIGSFVNNFVLNSAYTVGIGMSILAEEAALFGASVLTQGAMGGVAAMRTAANAARFGKAVKQAYNTKAVGNIVSGSVQLAKSLSKVSDAKDFYSAVRAGGAKLGKGALQFVNPLTRTTDDIIDMARGSASIRNMSNLAKAKQTFGSFYRDIRDGNLALSESKLEGGSARMDKVNELLSDYEKKNGKAPEGEDLERIYQQAEDTGYGVTAVNFPIIYMTNRVVLDGLFKFRGLKTLDEAAEMATQGVGFKKGTGYYDALADGWLKRTKQSLTNPKAYIGQGVSYFRRNLFEGIQENLQNVTSDAVGAYYDGVYKDPALGGFDFAAGNAWKALGDEFTSARGLETFASGFLMGGFMGKVQNGFIKDVPQVYYYTKDKIKGTNKLQEYKTNRDKTRQNAIAGLNELYSNPLKYFSSRNESAVVQKHTSDVMNQADDQGDAKTFQDAKDLKMFDHIFTALDNNTFDGLIGNYKELSKLDNTELANFLGIKDASKATEKLQEVVARAEQIKSRYETINNQFKNPFTPNKINKKSPEFVKEAIAYRSFESAKKTAIASQYGFDRALERMNSLYADLSSNRPINKSSSSDVTVLTDLDALDSEISLLDKEVKSYEQVTDEDQKKIGEQKKAKLERMMDFRDKLRNHLEKANQTEKEENGQITIQFLEETTEPLRESYKAYLREIAALNNDYVFDDKIDDSFAKMLDYYKLNQDARNYNKVVNTLLDPANLYRHAERLNGKFTELFENKSADINDRVERAQRMMEVSEMIKALAAQGVMLDPNELEAFVRTGKKPITFIDAATLKDLDASSPKYAAAQAILDIDNTITQPVTAAPAVTSAQPETKPAANSVAPTEERPADNTMDPELQSKLEDAYNQYLEEFDTDITFDEFVKRSPRAANIKATFNKAKAQPAETTAAVLQPDTSVQAQAAGTTRTEPVTTSTSQSEPKSKKETLRDETGFASRAYSNEVLKQIGLPTGGEGGALSSWKGLDFTAAEFKNSKVYQDNKEKIDGYLKESGINSLEEAESFQIIPTFYDGVPRVQASFKSKGVLRSLGNMEVSVNEAAYKLGKEKTEAEDRFAAEERAPVSTDAKADIEISSNSKGLAAALTNPTELAKKKGNLTASYPVTVRGKEYADAEAAYQALKETATKDDGPNSTYNLMVEILKAKLQQYPRLVSEITKAGGESWLSKATHQPTNKNTVWETGGKNWFIKALTEAYNNTKETETVQPVASTTEKTGSQKAQDLIDSVSSIRDLPDLNRADSGPITIDLTELISTGQAKSKDINQMLSKRRVELLQKISPKDLQKGDIVTFVDGRKGFVKSVTNDSVSIKLTNSEDPLLIVPASNLAATINNIEPGKLISMEATPDIEVNPQDQAEVKASQDAKSSFTENASSVKEVGDKAAKSAGTDNQQNLNNLLQNIGCKTGK
jgi:hypothetical protein